MASLLGPGKELPARHKYGSAPFGFNKAMTSRTRLR